MIDVLGIGAGADDDPAPAAAASTADWIVEKVALSHERPLLPELPEGDTMKALWRPPEP